MFVGLQLPRRLAEGRSGRSPTLRRRCNWWWRRRVEHPNTRQTHARKLPAVDLQRESRCLVKGPSTQRSPRLRRVIRGGYMALRIDSNLALKLGTAGKSLTQKLIEN